DGKTDSVTINERGRDGQIKNDLGIGDFDVEINSGPSFAVQKSESVEFFSATVANNPQVFNLIADLWAENLDITQQEQVKERLKTLVPQEILAKKSDKQIPPKHPAPKMILMQEEIKAKKADIEN